MRVSHDLESTEGADAGRKHHVTPVEIVILARQAWRRRARAVHDLNDNGGGRNRFGRMKCDVSGAVVLGQPRDAVQSPTVSMSTVSVATLARFAAAAKPV